tara:strand:- start:316 stop:528 length:213 start_codon:yes stop_codon:yes gene_type:complete
MKKLVLIEKKMKDENGAPNLSNVEVSVLGVFNTEAELRNQLKMMDNLQKAGRLDKSMSMDVLEVEFDGEA